MHVAQWVVDGDRLSLQAEDGTRVYPSAMDVFRHAFRGEQNVAGIPCAQIRHSIPSLMFSEVPAEPALRLSTSRGEIAGEFGVRAGANFVVLGEDRDQVVIDGTWFPVDISSLEEAKQYALDAGLIGRSIKIGSLLRTRRAVELPFALLDDAAVSSAELVSADTANITVAGLSGELYAYQADGVRFLRMIAAEEAGCILADEMGLGKTLQIITLVLGEINAGRRPSLVVAPATLLENWRREFNKFAPSVTVYTHSGNSRAGVASKLSVADVTVVSYETAVRDEPLLASVSWHALILDEAQAIKNPDAQRTRAVKRLPRNVSVAVSGTPLENRVEDLWSVADFCLPGLLGSLEDFRNEFSDELSDAARLAPVVGPLILRRRVADVAKDLPEKIEIPQFITMSERMAQRYEEIRTASLEEYGPSGGLVATTRLRSFCAHPSLLGEWSMDPADSMPKYQRMLQILEEVFLANEKALIFSTFHGVADILMHDLPARFPGGYYQIIDGRTPVSLRQEVVDGFFAHAGFGALFLNPKAAGTGLNITAANHVIHYNPEWNPALTAQASARAYRRKQVRPVTIHHLALADSVEEVIVERADFKRMLAGAAVSGHGGEVPASAIARALRISPLASLRNEP